MDDVHLYLAQHIFLHVVSCYTQHYLSLILFINNFPYKTSLLTYRSTIVWIYPPTQDAIVTSRIASWMGSRSNHQEFQVPKMEGFRVSLFSAILGSGFPFHKARIHTAYIGEDSSIPVYSRFLFHHFKPFEPRQASSS